MLGDISHGGTDIDFYGLKDYRGDIYSREKLKDLIKNKNIRNSANKLLEKKVKIFKLRLRRSK